MVAAGVVTKGKAYPWFQANKSRIIADEGGFPALVEQLVGRAIVMVMDDGKLTPAAAVFQAADEWKAEIRPQYDYRNDTYSLDAMLEREEVDERVDAGSLWFSVEDTYFPDDPDPMVERAYVALASLTEKQRAAFEMHVAGHGPTFISEALGLSNRSNARALVLRAQTKLRKALT